MIVLWLQFKPKSELKSVHRLTSTSLSCRCLPLATQEPCLTQCRAPLLLETVYSLHHNRGQGIRQALDSQGPGAGRRPYKVGSANLSFCQQSRGRREGGKGMRAMNMSLVCIIFDYICHIRNLVMCKGVYTCLMEGREASEEKHI